MRPLRIEIHGLTSFKEKQPIELEDLDLFVITGPTGAGKTTILDAMILSLYGRVPRASSHQVRGLITHGMAEAQVGFKFALNGETYRIARRVPRRGAQKATLERQDGDEWRNEVDGGGVTAVNERIRELLKLNYEAFTRAVVLPQGKFAEFLAGDGSKRRELLTELLGLNQYVVMGQRARARAKTARTENETTQRLLDKNYGDVSEEAVGELEGKAIAAEERLKKLADHVETAVGLADQHDDFADLADRVEAAAGALQEVADELVGVEKSARESEDHLSGSSKAADTAAGAVKAADEAATAARDGLRELKELHGDLDHLARVEVALTTVDRCEGQLVEQEALLADATTEAIGITERAKEKRSEVEKAERALEASAKRAKEAEKEAREAERGAGNLSRKLERVDEAIAVLEAAENSMSVAAEREGKAAIALDPAASKLQRAEESLKELEHANAAAVLAADLEPGDDCPVCDRPLEAHPKLDKEASGKLEKLRGEVQRLRQRHGDSVAEHRTAKDDLCRATPSLTTPAPPCVSTNEA